jgi:hypothetical protein
MNDWEMAILAEAKRRDLLDEARRARLARAALGDEGRGRASVLAFVVVLAGAFVWWLF